MRHSVKLLSILSTGTLLGCSQLSLAPTQREPVAAAGDRASVLSRVQPVTRIASPVPEVEHLWLQGRSAHGQGQLALAQDHYAKVLKERPTHPGALNALAVIYAQTDRLPQAIGLFEQALAMQPQASHVLNNLGYALLLAGRLSEAEAALHRAHELNPASALTRKNQELLAQAQARGATVLASPAAAGEPAAAVSGTTLVAIAPNVYELREPTAAAPSAAQARAAETPAMPSAAAVSERWGAVPAPAFAAPADLHGVRIEVSNGMGVRHMARRMAGRLVPLGLVAARVTNQPGYRQVRTELQFRAGQQNAAEALAQQLPGTPQLVPVRQLAGGIQLRLVLGHDLRGQALAVWLEMPEVQVATEVPSPVALNPQDGWRWG